jgi:hypothetical protein
MQPEVRGGPINFMELDPSRRTLSAMSAFDLANAGQAGFALITLGTAEDYLIETGQLP